MPGWLRVVPARRRVDLTDFGTTAGGMWCLAGCRNHYSKYAPGWHVAPRTNQHNAIEPALAEAVRLAGAPLIDLTPREADSSVTPLVTIVSDNGITYRRQRTMITVRGAAAAIDTATGPESPITPARAVRLLTPIRRHIEPGMDRLPGQGNPRTSHMGVATCRLPIAANGVSNAFLRVGEADMRHLPSSSAPEYLHRHWQPLPDMSRRDGIREWQDPRQRSVRQGHRR